MNRDHDARIRERAYQLWEEEGQPEGREAQHWAQARAEFADAAKTSDEVSRKKDGAPKSAKPAEAKAATAKAGTGKKKQGGKSAADKAPAMRSRGASATRTPRKSS